MRAVITLTCGLCACGFQPDGAAPTGGGDAAIDARGLPGDARAIDAAVDAGPDAGRVPGSPAIVQQMIAYAQGDKTLSATLPSPPTAGDVLLMIGAGTQSGPLDSVTGGGVAHWTRGAASDVRANAEIWYGVAATGASASVTIALSLNQDVAPIWMDVVEVSGLDTAHLVVDTAANNGSATPASTGSLMTGSDSELVVIAATDLKAATFGMPTGGPWTELTPIAMSDITQNAFYKLSTTQATIDPNLSETTHNWDAVAIALRVAPP